MSKLAVIRGFLKYKKLGISKFNSPSNIQAAVAYNEALSDLEIFLDAYEKGTLPNEFKDDLIKRSEEA